MKTFYLMLAFSFVSFTKAYSFDMNQLVLETVSEMPSEGGYELTTLPARRMMDAFTFRTGELSLDPFQATPSYCTTATYMVFYKVMEKYWAANSLTPSQSVLTKLKPMLERDGARLWGRWNSNGPGTAKFFHDAKMGSNFDDIRKAIPGDFIKMFWNNEVGKLERGHTAIFLGLQTVNGQKMLHFWASSKSTNGFAERLIPLTEAKRILFSRLDRPENFEQMGELSELDPFLESMLIRQSNWEELKKASGF